MPDFPAVQTTQWVHEGTGFAGRCQELYHPHAVQSMCSEGGPVYAFSMVSLVGIVRARLPVTLNVGWITPRRSGLRSNWGLNKPAVWFSRWLIWKEVGLETSSHSAAFAENQSRYTPGSSGRKQRWSLEHAFRCVQSRIPAIDKDAVPKALIILNCQILTWVVARRSLFVSR